VGYGVLKADVVLAPPGSVEAPLEVRPEPGDVDDDWVREIEGALGDRIGATAHDAAVAGALAVELAVRLGALGRSVVLIDGNVESPTLAKALPGDGDEGLVDILAFGVSAVKAVRRTLATGVSQVTAGSYPISVSALFEGDGFPRLLKTLTQGATVVLILPLRHLKAASQHLSTVVAIAGSVEGIRELATEAPGRDVVGVLAASGEETAAEPLVVAVEGREPVGEAAEEPVPEPVEEPVAEPVEEPLAEAVEEPAGDPWTSETAAPVEEPVPDEPVEKPARPEPSWAHAGEDDLITPAHPVRLERRRPRRSLTIGLTVAAIAIVGAWLGIRAFRGPAARPDRRAERPAAARVQEEPTGGEPVRPAGEDAGAEGVDDHAGGAVPGEGGPGPVSTAEEDAPTEAVRDEVEPPVGEIAGPGGRYTLFVTSHRVASEAREQLELLARSNVSATVVTTEVGDTGVWHRVAVSGGYPTLAQAREALARVERLGYEGAWIERSQESR
jgi:hypothetical protein